MSSKTAVGIEISADYIRAAMIRQSRQEMVLLKTASAPMPEGAVSGGNVKNAQLIAKTAKELCSKNKIPHKNIVISLVAKPAITRIMELPKELTMNPAQYVREELKHYAVLAGKSVLQDFCSLSGKSAKTNKVLLSAAEEEKVTSLIVAFNRIGLQVKAVEQNCLAYARAIFAGVISKKFGINIILLHIQEETGTLVLIRDGKADFIRSVNMPTQNLSDPETAAVIKTEIEGVRQFYDIEVEKVPRKWELVVAGIEEDGIDAGSISSQLDGIATHICSAASFKSDTKLGGEEGFNGFAAAGLAMKLLNPGLGDFKTNLMPSRTDEIHNMQKFALCAAVIMLACFLAVLASVPLITRHVRTAVEEGKKQTAQAHSLGVMLANQTKMTSKIKQSSEQLSKVEKLVKDIHPCDWSSLLAEISKRTPSRVRIVSMVAKDDTTLLINGESLDNESLHAFAKTLTKSPLIKTASLLKTEQSGTSVLILYCITCSLNKEKLNAVTD
jgi:type IV pilus assembly protein PilM